MSLQKQAEKSFSPSLCQVEWLRHELRIKPLFIYTKWSTLKSSHLNSSLGCFPLEVNQALPTGRSPWERPRKCWRDYKTQVASNWGYFQGKRMPGWLALPCCHETLMWPHEKKKYLKAPKYYYHTDFMSSSRHELIWLNMTLKISG